MTKWAIVRSFLILTILREACLSIIDSSLIPKVSVLKSGLVQSLGPKMGNRQLQPWFLVAYFGATTTEPLKPVLLSSVASKNWF